MRTTDDTEDQALRKQTLRDRDEALEELRRLRALEAQMKGEVQEAMALLEESSSEAAARQIANGQQTFQATSLRAFHTCCTEALQTTKRHMADLAAASGEAANRRAGSAQQCTPAHVRAVCDTVKQVLTAVVTDKCPCYLPGADLSKLEPRTGDVAEAIKQQEYPEECVQALQGLLRDPATLLETLTQLALSSTADLATAASAPISNDSPHADVGVSQQDVLKNRQQAHVMKCAETRALFAEAQRVFAQLPEELQTRAEAVAAAPSSHLPSGWERARRAGVRAVVECLEREAGRVSAQCEALAARDEEVRGKLERINAHEQQRQQLEGAHVALISGMRAAALRNHMQMREVCALVQDLLCQHARALAHDARRARSSVSAEMSAFAAVPWRRVLPRPMRGPPQPRLDEALDDMAARLAAGDTAAAPLTLRQLAARARSCYSQPGGVGTRGGSGEAALEAVLGAAPSLLPPCTAADQLLPGAASARRALAALNLTLQDIGDQLQEEGERSQVVRTLVGELKEAVARQAEAVKSSQVARLAEVAEWKRDAVLVKCGVVEKAIQEWWLQPALFALDWVKVEGRSAKEWLAEIKQLEASVYSQSAFNAM